VILPGLFFSIKNRKWIWPSRTVLIAMGGLLATALISFFINIDKASDFVDYIGEFRWMVIYLFLLQFYNIFYQRIDWHKVVLTTQIVLTIAGFYSFYQFFSGHDLFRHHAVVFHYIYDGSRYFRPNSFFGLPTTYGYASAMFFSLALAMLMREKRPTGWKLFVRRLYFVVGPFNIFLTFTRAAWMAAMASTLSILALTNRRYFVRTAIVFVVMISALYTSFSSFSNRVNSVFDSNYVANENRIYLWKANIDIFKEHPLFGLGFDENRKQIDTYLQPYNKPNVMRNHPHSTYINFLAGLGLFGLGFFLLFAGYHLKICIDGFRNSTNSMHKTLFLGVLGLQMVLLIGGFTECNFEDLELCHQYILFIALAEYLKRNYGEV
jgi:O-antigen ligase